MTAAMRRDTQSFLQIRHAVQSMQTHLLSSNAVGWMNTLMLAAALPAALYPLCPTVSGMDVDDNDDVIVSLRFPFARPTDYYAMSIRLHFVRMSSNGSSSTKKSSLNFFFFLSFFLHSNADVSKLMHLPNNVNAKRRSMFELRTNKSTATSEKQLVNHKSRRIKSTALSRLHLLRSLSCLRCACLFLFFARMNLNKFLFFVFIGRLKVNMRAWRQSLLRHSITDAFRIAFSLRLGLGVRTPN